MGDIRRRRDELIGRAAVCWLPGNSHNTEPHHLGDALRNQLDIHHDDVQVLKHFPEQFLVIFNNPRDRQRVVEVGVLLDNGRRFQFAAWSERRYANNVSWEFRVKVRIEGIPVHCWAEEVATKALGKSCAIHYLEETTRRRQRTRSFDLWAWCCDPCDIPTEARRVFDWDYGVPDTKGERLHGRRAGHDRGRDMRPRRDDDDYDGRRNHGNRRHRSLSAWARNSRCRGGAEDCISSNRWRGRGESPPRRNRPSGGAYQAPAQVWKVKEHKKEKKTKRVSFADPIATELKPPKRSITDDSIMLIKVANSTTLSSNKEKEGGQDGHTTNNSFTKMAEHEGMQGKAASSDYCGITPSEETSPPNITPNATDSSAFEVIWGWYSDTQDILHFARPIEKTTMDAIQDLIEHSALIQKKSGNQDLVTVVCMPAGHGAFGGIGCAPVGHGAFGDPGCAPTGPGAFGGKHEITDLCTLYLPAWLVLGDFNLILNAQEENNARVNLPMINRFRSTVDNLELARIDLRGRKYTWCNDQQSPTMTRIDHFFASADWLELFPRTNL
ncbi:unnamed protein product [Miscanthus lutarioriparius]|uniref:DUF4283 domain-containing protein n=1 Tax=Miscanthus lutarioriparius TaxID=422564 RepID=A0A811RFI7_9POAL|nr:unnamed protein product [Miscanthus lutarioriparius]